jgi:hypothetical protein
MISFIRFLVWRICRRLRPPPPPPAARLYAVRGALVAGADPPRCEGCGALLPDELRDAVACQACINAAVDRIRALPDWREASDRQIVNAWDAGRLPGRRP